MSKMNFSKGRFSRFISSKGFYVALAVCLVGAGAATWVAVNRTITGIENANSQMLESESYFHDFPMLEETEKSVPDVPKTYLPPSSSSSTPSSSSAAFSEPAPSSDAPVSSPVTPSLAYSLPVNGKITAPYSGGELVKNATLNDWRTHDGIDIAAARGDDIYAAADGVVTDVKNDPLWGTVLTIKHSDGHETFYCGLNSKLPVQVGENVMMRQVIGTLDGVPCEISEDSHLHFAMKRNSQWTDPMSVVAKAE